MTALLDKVILFVFCTTIYLANTDSMYAVVFIIASVILAAVSAFQDDPRFDLAVFSCAFLVSLFFPAMLYFLPIFSYDLFRGRFRFVVLLSLIPLFVNFSSGTVLAFIIVSLLIVLSYVLMIRTDAAEKIRADYNHLRDEVTEKQFLLETKNRELLEKQDYDIHLATLKERNRIAAELHDNIGHVLTSSLLQTGALLATSTDERTKTGLQTLRDSLSKGMDEVRSSIHNLHDDSISLYDDAKTQIDRFVFCEIKFRYNIESTPSIKIRNAFLSVLKEGLANIARHSNATLVTVMLIEHPALYQLIIRDNGTTAKEFIEPKEGGMGLPSIRTRIESLGGNVAFKSHDGFEIFASVPKEEE